MLQYPSAMSPKCDIIYLPTFPKSNAWDFISIIPKFPKNFRQHLNITEDVPTILEDVPMISEGCRMLRCEARNLGAISFACYLHCRTQTWHLVPLARLFWVEIELNISRYGWWTSSPELWVRREKLSMMREIDVFDPQAWDSPIMRESWQV